MPLPATTNEDTIAVLNARKDKDGDTFRLKVFRKKTTTALPEVVALFDDANVVHAASPEEWLPKLAGGGPVYMIKVFHTSDLTTQVGSDLNYSISGDPGKVDPAVLRRGDWRGPPTLSWWPEKDAVGGPVISYTASPTPGASSGVTAPQTSVPAGGPQALVSSVPPGIDAASWAALQAEKDRLAAREREYQDRLRQIELERLAAQHDAKMRELEFKISNNATHALAKTGPTLVEIITALGAAFGPSLAAMIQSNNEMKALMFKQQADVQAKQSELLMHVLEKKSDDTPATKLMATVTDAVGSVMKLQSEAMQMIQETVMGPQDPPGLKMVKEIAKAVGSIAATPKVAVPRALPAKGSKPGQPIQVVNRVNGIPAPIPGPQIPTLDRIEQLIRAYTAPNVVASVVLQAVQDPNDAALQEALSTVGGDLIALFQQRLSGWVTERPENVEYIREVAAHLNAAVSQAEATVDAQMGGDDEGDDDATEDAA